MTSYLTLSRRALDVSVSCATCSRFSQIRSGRASGELRPVSVEVDEYRANQIACFIGQARGHARARLLESVWWDPRGRSEGDSLRLTTILIPAL